MRDLKGSLTVTALVVAAQIASCLTTTQSPATNVTPQSLTSTAKDTTVAPGTEPPATGKAPLESSLPSKVPLEPPSFVKAPLEVPSASKAPLEEPLPTKSPLEEPLSTKSLLEEPSSRKSPLEVPLTSKAPLEVPSPSKPPSESTVKIPLETSSTGKPPSESSTPYVETAKETTAGAFTSRPTTTTRNATPSTTEEQTTTATTTTAREQYSTEWQDIEEEESERLLDFVVSEIQKLKVEHRELDECQELDLSSVLSGKKLSGKTVKYSITLKVQPQVKNTVECLQQNSTTNNMHPEICEADVTEGDRGGTNERTLLRSTCLQVEELQD